MCSPSQGIKEGSQDFSFYWNDFSENQGHLLRPFTLSLTTQLKWLPFVWFAPLYTWTTCLTSLPCLSQDTSTRFDFWWRLSAFPLHLQTFLPSNLPLWVLCLCSHAFNTTATGLPSASSVWLAEAGSVTVAETKVKGPWSWLVGREQWLSLCC